MRGVSARARWVRLWVRSTLRLGEPPPFPPQPPPPGHSSLVRRFFGTLGSVKLPVPVHPRRTSLDFPWRSGSVPPPDRRRASRLPREMLPHMRGVSDRAGSISISRSRCRQCGLPLLITASAPRSAHGRGEGFSRLNTQLMRTPVNASPPPLRTTTHDSGPTWLATPSPYDTRSHDISPALTGARSEPLYTDRPKEDTSIQAFCDCYRIVSFGRSEKMLKLQR